MLATLVVGLGGTGSWTLAHLKQRLLADHRWQLLGQGLDQFSTPGYEHHTGPVKLRTLDVDRKNRPAITGGVLLDAVEEDLALGGAIGRTIEAIQSSDDPRRTWPTIQRWLPKEDAVRYDLQEANKFMTEGAGQIRQFGRIAFFLDQLNGAQQLTRLSQPLFGLAQGNNVQVIVVASVAGGTGAGLLIDTLAYLQTVRNQLAGQVSVRTIVYLVLPGAFAGVVTRNQDREGMQANGRAALRELDRMLNAHATFEVEWLPGQPHGLSAAAADVCYLLDGSRDVEKESPQLESHVPFDSGLPAAIADAIYLHVHPASGAALGRDYPNLSAILIGGTEARYSSFGSYSITYAWEPLMRSLSLQAAAVLLGRLLAETESAGRSRMSEFLSTGASGALGTADSQQELASFAAEALSTVPDSAALAIPGAAWLEPRFRSATVPQLPNLFDKFPGIGKIRTEYDNPQVVAEVGRYIDDFWGPLDAEWQGREDPRFHEASNHNMAQSTREWKRALYIASVALLNDNDRIGGISAAVGLLTGLQARIEQFAIALANMPKIDLAPFRQAVEDALNEMNDLRKWDDAGEQRDFIDARQQLLELELADECRRRVADLSGRYLATVKDAIRDIKEWQSQVDSLRTQALEQRDAVDNARKTASLSPVQRFLPLPGDELEEKLWIELFGDPAEGVPAGLKQCLAAVHWTLDEGENRPTEILFTSQSTRQRRGPIELKNIQSITLLPFESLRTRSVWEMLERAGETDGALVDELTKRGARFSVFDANGQQDPGGQLRQHRDWNYVFARWLQPRAGENEAIPGAGLSSSVGTRLTVQGVKPEDLGALQRTGVVPSDDKIMAFSARHLIAIEAFPAVNILDAAYKRRREQIPCPHLLLEERGAARFEARSEELARQGALSKAVAKVNAEEVLLCSDEIFLKFVSACVAGDRITFGGGSLIQGTGTWALDDGTGSKTEIGDQASLTKVLLRILRVDDHQSAAAREAIQRVGDSVASDSAGQTAMRDFAKGTKQPTVKLSPGLTEILQVAAAMVVA